MRSLIVAVTALALAVPLLPGGGALAKPPPHAGKGKGAEAPPPNEAADSQPLSREEAAIAEAIIEAISGRNIDLDGREPDIRQAEPAARGTGLPPGLAGRGSLPPGLQRHLERTGELPPGLQKRIADGLMRRMPDKQVSFQGTEAIIRDRVTGEVVKVIRDILELGRPR